MVYLKPHVSICEGYESDKDNSLVLKKELLCKRLKNDDIWGWEYVKQDMQEILKEHKIAFLDTFDYEIIHEGSDGSRIKGSVTIDYDFFKEAYNLNSNIIFIPTSQKARNYLSDIEEYTGLKLCVSTLVMHQNIYVPDMVDGDLLGGLHYCDSDNYFDWIVNQYLESDD